MKKLLFILSFLICFVSAFAQTKYPLPYDTVIVMKPNGTGYLKASKGNFADSLWHRIVLATNDSSKLAATTEWVKRQNYGSGSTTNPAGNYGNFQLNRNGQFAAAASDSFSFNGGVLRNKGSSILGSFSGSGVANLTVAGGVNVSNSSTFNFPTGAWNNISAVDSPVTQNYLSLAHAVGGNFVRTMYMAASGLEERFQFGNASELVIGLYDSSNFNPQNLDGAAAFKSTLSFGQWSGTPAGRSVIMTGSSFSDAMSASLSQIYINGAAGGNRFYLRGGGSLYTGYVLSSNGSQSDTIENVYGFRLGSAANLTPKMLKVFGLFGDGMGFAGNHVDSLYDIYVQSGINSLVSRNFLGGFTSFGGGNTTLGAHTAATHTVEIRGTLQTLLGSECAGCILTDVAGDGVVSWQPSPGSGLFWALTGTSTLTGDVTIDGVANSAGIQMNSNTFIGLNADDGSDNSGMNVTPTSLSFAAGNNGGAHAGILTLDGTDIITSFPIGTGTLKGASTDSINYVGGSYVQRDWVLDHIANSASGTVTSVSGTSNRITSTGGTTPVIDISASYVGQNSITTLGTIGTGVWQGTLVAGQYGGTGVANTGKTITLGGNLTTSGAFASTFTMTNTTTVTFPTTGTLVNTAVTTLSSLTSVGTITTGGLGTGAVIGGVTMTLGSDAANDIYYRSGSGVLTRLANGTTGQYLAATTGSAPSWGTPAGGGGITIGTTTITSGTTTRILYDNAGVVGEYTLTGTGTVVAMQTSPSFTTPALGVATATSINKVTITAPATSATLTIVDGGSLITAGAFATTITSSNTTNSTLPAGTHTLAGLDVAQSWTAIQTYNSGVTTGTTSTSGVVQSENSLTSGTAHYISSSSITSGTLLNLVTTGTVAAAGNEAINIDRSGANGTNAITVTGERISVTNTNGTSGTNVGLDITASGATTNNFAITAAGSIQVTSANIAQGTTASAISVAANSLTTGTGIYAASSSITTGNLLNLVSTSTVGNGFSLASITSSGANGTSAKTVTGQTISVTNTGTTSTNIGLSVTATGASTNTAINATGNIATTTQVLSPDGSTSLPSFADKNTVNTGINFRGTGISIDGIVGGVAYFALNTNGFQIKNGTSFAISQSDPTTTGPDIGFGRSGASLGEINDGTTGNFRDLKLRKTFYDATNTPAGTTGNQTINKASGTVNIAAAGTTVTVTNSLVTTSSIVYCVVRTNDATATGIKNVVPASGSFVVILNAAATAEVSIGFVVFN